MQHIKQIDIDHAGNSQHLIDKIRKQMGSVPNIFATMAHSPAVLEGYLAFSSALATGELNASLREQIALTVAGQNDCDYCASAHAFLGQKAGLDESELSQSLKGTSTDPEVSAILAYVKDIVANKGVINPSATQSLKSQGVSDAQIAEIIANVGLNIFTNYFNHIAGTTIDFPLVHAQKAQ